VISTHTLQLFAVGVTLYAGFFHWALQRHLRGGAWLTAWSALAALYMSARALQVATHDPEVVLWASRAFTAIGPALIWTILRFTLEFTDQRPSLRARRAMLAAVVALVALSLGTPWILTDSLMTRRDMFGTAFLTARGGPAYPLAAGLVFGALGWALVALARAKSTAPRDRAVLSICLLLYTSLAVSSVFSSLGVSPFPGLGELGPLVVAIGTSNLVAHRDRDLARNLSTLVDAQTAALRESEERYRRLVERAPIGVLACDERGDVVAISDRFREIIGVTGAPSATPVNLLHGLPAFATPHLDDLARALETGEVVHGEFPYTNWHGKPLDLKMVIAPQRAPDGGSRGALILIEDVTERRAVEARLRQSLKLESIGQLATGIAHGINAPMTEVRGHLAAMRAECDALRKQLADAGADPTPFADLEELIDDSCEGVERAIAIVRDMLELSRGGSVAIEPVDLNELLHGVVRMAATQRRPGVELVERYGELPRVAGNPGQLRQVFLNLVVNALQAVRSRGVIEIVTQPEAGGVCVRVRDDGPGIAPQDRERLFVPFFTTKPAGEGTGLGLFLSYQIVQGHHGEIRVQSRPGLGATFEVWLPRERSPGGGAA
jgi:PAS domain S-box-containing protein